MESLQALHTAWKPCNLAGIDSSLHGDFDPPQTLGQGTAMVGPTSTKAPDLLTTPAPASPVPQLVPPQPEKTSSQRASQAISDPSSNNPGRIYGPSAAGSILPPSKTQGLATQAGVDSKANKPALAHQDTDRSPPNTSTTKEGDLRQGSDSKGNAADLVHQGTDDPPAASPETSNPSVVGPHAPDPPASPAPTSLFTNSYNPSNSIQAAENRPAVISEAGNFSVASSAPPASSPPANSPTNRQRPSEIQGDPLLSRPILSQESTAAITLAAQVFTHAASRPTGIAADYSEIPGTLHTSAAFVVGTSKLTDVSSMPLSETDHMGGLVSNGLDPSGAFNLGYLAGVTPQAAAQPLSSNGVIVAPVRVGGQAEVSPIVVGTVMYSPVLPATQVTVSPEAGGSSNLPSGGTISTPGQPNVIPESIGSKGSPTDGTARSDMPPGSVDAVAGHPGPTSLVLTQQPTVTAPRVRRPSQSSQAPEDEGTPRGQGDSPARQTKQEPAYANSAPIVVGGTTYTPVPATPTAQAAYSTPVSTGPRGALSSNPSPGNAVSETHSYKNNISGNSPSESALSIQSGSIIPKSTTTNSTQAFSSGANTASAVVSAQAHVGGVARVAVGIRGLILMMLGWMALTC